MRRRRNAEELLDRPDQKPEALAHSLRDVERVNRWLGGYRALRRHLAPHTNEAELRILDVGAGDGATLLHLRAWAPEGWRFVGLELNPGIARIARTRTSDASRIRITRGDALRLPFENDSFDVALCTLTLHHFGNEAAIRVVEEMARVARGRILVNDLERSRAHHLGARLLAATLWRGSPITRHDGPLSVRRSFTVEELEAIGNAAGLARFQVRRRLLFRVVLDGIPESGAPGATGAPPAGATVTGATGREGATP